MCAIADSVARARNIRIQRRVARASTVVTGVKRARVVGDFFLRAGDTREAHARRRAGGHGARRGGRSNVGTARMMMLSRVVSSASGGVRCVKVRASARECRAGVSRAVAGVRAGSGAWRGREAGREGTRARARGRSGDRRSDEFEDDGVGGADGFEFDGDDDAWQGDGSSRRGGRGERSSAAAAGGASSKKSTTSSSSNGARGKRTITAEREPATTDGEDTEADVAEEDKKTLGPIGDDMDLIESVVMDAREESFALKKKRMELIIEEKEWELETPSTEDEKMVKIVEYVNAVEAFKELCSSQVPNTVSDLLGQYVNVYHLAADAPGYEQALAFLGIDPDEDEDDEDGDYRGRIIDKSSSYDDDDEDEDEDDEEYTVIEMELTRFGATHDVSEGLHLAQDIEGNWRWLEDDLGRPMSLKPFGEFQVKLMSIEQMLKYGLNVNSLHEEVDPLELLDFTGCRTWQDTLQVSQDATAALAHMEEDGWKIDTRSWSNDSESLLVVKELVPLRTMSFVDGTFASERGASQAADDDDDDQDPWM